MQIKERTRWKAENERERELLRKKETTIPIFYFVMMTHEHLPLCEENENNRD